MTGGFFNILANATAESADIAASNTPNIGVVAGLGMGTVFVGLICLVVLLTIMSAIFSRIKPKATKSTENAVAANASSANEKMDDETVAAVSAAIAETLGRDVSGIRITSIKKVN